MSFIPTEEQVDGLSILLKQCIRESVKIKVIRFIEWGFDAYKVEVCCYEDCDRYLIDLSGKIKAKYGGMF